MVLSFLIACEDPKPGADDTDLPSETDTTDTTTDTTDTTTDTTDTTAGADGWCAVQTIIATDCLVCHSAVARLGGLDLQSDAYTALVNAASSQGGGAVLVSPGDAAASVLYQKLMGTQTVGDPMPPSGMLAAADTDAVLAWITSGASSDCSGVDTDVEPTAYHPPGFSDPSVHGHDAKYQVETCVTCHGQDLNGAGDVPSCDTCHEAGWRENCTWCHGEQADGTGAPPVHISGVDDGAAATFIPHLSHTLATDMHRAFDCTECHTKPTDVLSAGHLFLGDTTPGRAETDFALSISDRAAWNGNGTCNNLWCHGNGQADNGRIQHDSQVNNCHGCHADGTSGLLQWLRMSGRHSDHLPEGIACSECHGDTVNASNDIIDFDLHINRTADVALRQGMTWNNGRCTGTCHREVHNNRSW
jgi:hypothetical protein